MQREFNRLCLLISDLLNILRTEVSHKLLEANANQEGIHLNPSQLIAVTNALVVNMSRNPSMRRISTDKDLSQIRCYNCNKTGHIAKYCRNRKKSNSTTNEFGYNFHKHQK